MAWWAIPALWLAWIIYWLAAAGAAKPTARQESPSSAWSHMLPLALAVLLMSAPVHRGWPGLRFLPPSDLWAWLGTALVVAGLAFACWARVHIGGNWSGRVTVKQDHELVRTGPYAWVRHPIYTGLLLAFLGNAIAIGQWRGLLAVALMWYAFGRKLRLEEDWMMRQFPADYPAYRAAVPALIPRLL